ncbi:MAG: PilZ domain-containing protein [Rhodospirillaceae bacterium]|nr:PilZ domain-containing protein [Rhodospirillaceae bacterium]
MNDLHKDTDDHAERRRAERYIVNLPTDVMIKGARVTCRLIDISEGGALIETSGPVTVGDKVSLDLPNVGPTIATVVRVSASHIAMAFPGAIIISSIVR